MALKARLLSLDDASVEAAVVKVRPWMPLWREPTRTEGSDHAA